MTELVSDSHLDSSFLDTVDTVSDQPETSWMLHLQLNSKSIPFKLDTGAEVTAISPDTHSCISSVELRPPQKTLSGPPSVKLNVLGQSDGTFTYEDRQVTQPVFVAEGLKNNLLGLPAIVALNLVTRLDMVSDIQEEILNSFHLFFLGWETLAMSITFCSSKIQNHLQFSPHDMCRFYYEPRYKRS